MMTWGMTWTMLVMALGWIVVVVALLGVVWWIIPRLRRAGNPDPLDVLRQRYARGEISRDEFERQRRDLAA